MKSTTPVPPELFKAVQTLRIELMNAYGCDYAYTIVGKGHILAASNMKNGHIEVMEEKPK